VEGLLQPGLMAMGNLLWCLRILGCYECSFSAVGHMEK
jgi:hypothetical protein